MRDLGKESQGNEGFREGFPGNGGFLWGLRIPKGREEFPKKGRE